MLHNKEAPLFCSQFGCLRTHLEVDDLSVAVTGYDFITGQYVAGWERLASLIGVLPILDVAGANMRYADEFIDTGDSLARYIGKACSFDEETPVTTEVGAIPIKDVDVGDLILATHHLRIKTNIG